MALFRKAAPKELPVSRVSAKERILFEILANDDGRVAVLVDKLKNKTPLVVNFEALDIDDGNKFLSFFQGACYALDGETRRIADDTYLFAIKEDFLDGSLEEFLANLKA